MGKVTKAVGVAGAVAGAAYLSKSENRQKVKRQLAKITGKENSSYLKKLGKPSDIDDANMVDEGAMTSVQYYNRLQEEKTEEN
ncbi:hypothetical protein EPH95_05840 [Salicibibacter halophilus]|uniref:YtxH domain-containing protein n=1 Tax=Salicibibacter halophilus TaxID=2502791 RepID=A0A514LG01_9BACI|nr:hypothetical protein [Salicibibacter halophilus]QDI90759.1 hypothetical protein EPH95_05840 [Salicibibacter halophilus]